MGVLERSSARICALEYCSNDYDACRCKITNNKAARDAFVGLMMMVRLEAQSTCLLDLLIVIIHSNTC